MAWNCTITNFNKRHVLTSHLNFVLLCYKFAREFSKSYNSSDRQRSAELIRKYPNTPEDYRRNYSPFLLIVSSLNNIKKYNIFLFNTIIISKIRSLRIHIHFFIVNFEIISHFIRLSENFNESEIFQWKGIKEIQDPFKSEFKLFGDAPFHDFSTIETRNIVGNVKM